MKLIHILEKYDTALLDQISADKVDEAISLRLPQPVIIQEIISALSSQSYIANKILYCKPPAFAILNLIFYSPLSASAKGKPTDFWLVPGCFLFMQSLYLEPIRRCRAGCVYLDTVTVGTLKLKARHSKMRGLRALVIQAGRP